MSPLAVSMQKVKAITFDVFGTLVDWYGSLVREGEFLGMRTGLDIDWNQLAREWRAGYGPALQKVNEGIVPWETLDFLHLQILEDLLPRFGIADLSPGDVQEFNQAWHRLQAWPDVSRGLSLLRSNFIVAPLSNGNISLLVDLARHNSWDWDCVLSCELAGIYKPRPAVYQTAAQLLGLPPEEILMVAAHSHDLEGARGVGMRTGFLHRPMEFGQNDSNSKKILAEAHQLEFDLYMDNLGDLAVHLDV